MRLSGCILICFLLSCSAGNRYHVSGRLEGGGDGIVRLLKYTGQSKYVTVDSTRMKDGKFSFKGAVGHPVNVILGIGDQPYNFGFWLENSRITLTAPADSVYRARVSGSAAQLENDAIRKFLAPYDENCRRLSKEAGRAMNAADISRLEQQVDACWENKKDAIIQYIKEHNNSFPAASLIKSISYALTWQELDELINVLSPKVAASEEIQMYKERVNQLKTVDIGKKAPDFTIPDTRGELVNAYQELRRNELTLIDFWASWCGPCRRENPNLVKAYQRFHDRGFGILSISLDKKKEDWIKAIKADGLPWTHVSNLRYWDDPVVKQYVVHSVPANVLLDKEGNIVARNLKGESLLKFLNSHLQQPVRQLEIKGLNKPVNIAIAGKLRGIEGRLLLTGGDSSVIAYQIAGDTALTRFTVPLPGSVQHLAIMDAPSGQSSIIAVTGASGYAKNVDVEVFLISQTKEGWKPDRIYVRKSPRPQINFLEVVDINNDREPDILVSYFESKYNVETIKLSRNLLGGWNSQLIALKRMASSHAVGGLPGYDHPVIAAGRPYGDSLGISGDAYLMADRQGKFSPISPIPSFRGVKAVAIGDGDNDGKNEIFIGDGWHQDYGKIARGRLAVVKPVDTGFTYQLIEDVKGQYGISQIVAADITGDNKNELIVTGNRFLRIYSRVEDSWKVFCDEKIKPDQFSVGDINNDGCPELVLSGKSGIRVYNFRDLPFSPITSHELITEVVKPADLIGRPAPALQVDHWYNGEPTSLAALKGKVVLLDFWATWCKPCIKLFPQLKDWQRKHGKDGLVILGLTREDESQKLPVIEDFIRNEDFAYRIAVSEEPINNLAYGVGGIPHVVLIDKKGIVRKYKVGSGENPEFEAALLKCLSE